MNDTATKSLNIVLIGCGQIVTHHIDAIFGANHNHNNNHHINRCHLWAVCDPSPERREIILQHVQDVDAAAVTSPTTLQFRTLEELIEYSEKEQQQQQPSSKEVSFISLIDIILIAVPHDLHESIAIRALEVTAVPTTTTTGSSHHRTLVVLEKPIAITIAACEVLRQASIQYQYRLIIAEQSPYWPAVQRAKTLIHIDHAIGDQIISMASYYYESMRDNITSGSVEETTGNLGWRGSIQRAGGGITMDGGLHWIRPIREICGNHLHTTTTNKNHQNYRISKVMGVVCPIPSIQSALGMEGETLGHALLELTCDTATTEGEAVISNHSDASSLASPSPLLHPPIIATYSACMLPSPAVMAYDRCPYLRIIGTTGEIVIAGTGLQKHTPNAGGLRLYNPQYPQGKEMLVTDTTATTSSNEKNDNTMQSHPPRTDFFMAFHGLWDEIRRIRMERDDVAAHETVIRAIDDVRTVLAIYRSSQTQQWEYT